MMLLRGTRFYIEAQSGESLGFGSGPLWFRIGIGLVSLTIGYYVLSRHTNRHTSTLDKEDVENLSR